MGIINVRYALDGVLRLLWRLYSIMQYMYMDRVCVFYYSLLKLF